MVGSSIWRRSDGPEGLIIFGSRRRQTAANGGTVHLSLRTNVITAAKARAKLIQPILDGPGEAAETGKAKRDMQRFGELIQRYQSHAEDQATMARNSGAPSQSLGVRGCGTAVAAIGFCVVPRAKHAQSPSHSFCG